jgi:transcriptional regulator with XRE-family HTH domain
VRIHVIDTEELKRLLNERWLTRADLARKTGLSTTLINYLVNGERNPSLTTAQIIAHALGVPMDRFVTAQWVDRPHPRRPPSA